LRKAPIFFAENWQKSQKIVIVTSTPGHEFFFLFEGLIVILDAHSDMLTPGSVDTDSEGLRAILNFTPGPQG
jgi:hypothetical protein